MNKNLLYDSWVERVCRFLSHTGPILGPGGRTCVAFQSKPEIKENLDAVFLGYNPHEDWGFGKGVDKNRFYYGNQSFYNGDARYKNPWKVWYKLYNAMKFVDFTKPMDDGNFVFMNAVYFGSRTIRQLKSLENSADAINKCLEFTNEVIHDIFVPKVVVCFSVNECFNLLSNNYNFENTETIRPSYTTSDGKVITSSHIIKSGKWNGITVIGIPHPSGRVDNDSWGAIATFLKQQFQSLI